MQTRPLIVLIGIITYLRPIMLAQALASLANQRCQGLAVELVVVDNDADAGSRTVYEQFRDHFPFPSAYLVEPTQGITHARNRILEYAVESGATYVALIDDDEVADPDWIAALHATITQSGADGVQGAVEYRLPDNAPAWAVHEYARKNAKARRQKGAVRSPDSNNVIFSVALVRDMDLRFDNRFAMTGGEDSEFFLRARQKGARFIATNSARTLETVPASRMTLAWHWLRYFRNGANAMRIALINGRYLRAAVLLGKAVLRLLVGLGLLPLSLVVSTLRFQSLRKIASAVGHFSGLAAISYREYRHIHGE